MKKNNKSEKKTAEFVLQIEISDSSSELIMRLEEIIENDITTHKLPKDFDSLKNKGGNEWCCNTVEVTTTKAQVFPI